MLQKQYSTFVKVVNIGETVEKRSTKLVEIGFARNADKPSVFIEGGIHGREWISPATATYIINELVTKYSETLLQKINFVILPVANPDGYEFSRENDRMWRKNRRPLSHTSGFTELCLFGVDLNRNFDSQWAPAYDTAAKCQETYSGPKPFSEPETINLSEYIIKNKHKFKSYISLHSYSMYWFHGYGYAQDMFPPDVEDLKTLADFAVKAVEEVNGNKYIVGSSADLLKYIARGDSVDWAKEKMGIKYCYGIELAPYSDEQWIAFALPSERIIETGEEIWAGLHIVARKIIEDSGD